MLLESEVVVFTVAGELHAVGARMVADRFELAVSATLPSNIPAVAGIVEAMRVARPVVVLVGGRLFDLVPDLWQVVGADGSASDASVTVRRATALVGGSCWRTI